MDPLGYQGEVDRIANLLLPGVTVNTQRIRYLSFLCWAIRMTDNRPALIDLWDMALSVGEYQRDHESPCRFIGSNKCLEKAEELRPGNRLRKRPLLDLTARKRYLGLARETGLVISQGQNIRLTELGEVVANEFGKGCPRKLPARVSGCLQMPCLSEMTKRELAQLHVGLLTDMSDSARKRLATFRHIKKIIHQRYSLASEGTDGADSGLVKDILRHFLYVRGDDDCTRALHEAAVLELEALPLSRLFIFYYKGNRFTQIRLIPNARLARPFSMPDPAQDAQGFLKSLATHLVLAERMGRPRFPLNLPDLLNGILRQHQEAKPDGPWVDENWRALRTGLAPQAAASLHGYRFGPFASLLSDLGAI